MSRYNSCRELAQKMDNEGGLDGMIFGYGLTLEDLPDDMPLEHKATVSTLLGLVDLFQKAESYVYERMDDDPNPGDWDYKDTTKEEDRCEPW